MKALYYSGRLELRDGCAVPVPSDDEALIRMRVAGICSTDLEITRGYKGYEGVLGHEFVGEVVECTAAHLRGKRVCGEINISCGHCPECRAGRREHCRLRRVLGISQWNGAFADYLLLPSNNLHVVPDSLSDEEAVFVEPLAAAFQVLAQITVSKNDRVLVLGDGKLGLLCAQALLTTGARVVLAGKHEDRLRLGASLGFETVLVTAAKNHFDYVVEATGSASGLETALRFVRPRGTIVLKSTLATPVLMDLAPAVVNEVQILGSRCGPFPRAITALARREVEVRPLISERFPLAESLKAMEAADHHLKVLLDADAA